MLAPPRFRGVPPALAGGRGARAGRGRRTAGHCV